MFHAAQWTLSRRPSPPPPAPLPFALYGTIEGEMLSRKMQAMTPLDDYMLQRFEKQNYLNYF